MPTEDVTILSTSSHGETTVPLAPVDVGTVEEMESHSPASPGARLAGALRARARSGALVTTGFLLSPLSPWNDAWINIPIAYVLARVVAIVDRAWFLPTFVIAYWATNVLGLAMMHRGGSQLLGRGRGRRSYLLWAVASLAYTAVIVLLAQLKPLQP